MSTFAASKNKLVVVNRNRTNCSVRECMISDTFACIQISQFDSGVYRTRKYSIRSDFFECIDPSSMIPHYFTVILFIP